MKIQSQDFFQQVRFVKKENRTYKHEDNRSLFYKKDISLLARNGLDFETSKKVMDLKKEDYLKIMLDYFNFFPFLFLLNHQFYFEYSF